MRSFYSLFFLVLFVFCSAPVLGQALGDTLGLTGGMADTVVADRLFAEMKELIKERKWEEVEAKGASAKVVYTRLFGEKCRQVADVWHQLGLVGKSKGDYNWALENYEKALNIRLKIFGEEHLDVASSYTNLGITYESMGKYDEALEYKQKALNIRLKILGEEHPDVASSYNNLGVIYNFKEDYDKAIEYMQKALKIRLIILGEEHPKVADSYNNLANTYESKGDYDNAVKYNQKALNIKLKILGEEDLRVVDSYNNFANTYESMGDYDKALEYDRKALTIQLKILGEEHPDVALSYNNLGATYESKGEYDKALEYKQKALSIRLKILGEEHPHVASSYNNLGNSYCLKGEYDNALEYYQKAVSIRLKILGEEHLGLTDLYNNLGVTYQSKGEYDKALGYKQKALNIRLKILGEEHPDVASSYNNLGSTFVSKGEYNKALEYYQKALNIRLKILGEEHPDVASSYNNLGVTYESKGEYDKALEYKQKALNIRLKVLGEEHPDVASSYNNLGVTYESKGGYDKALEYKQKALNIRLKVLGEKHPDVFQSYNNLGALYKSKGEYDTAVYFYQKSIHSCGYVENDFSKVNSMQNLVEGLYGMSWVLSKKYTLTNVPQFLNQIFDYTGQIISALNYQQLSITEESSKSFHLSKNYPIYEQAISVSLLKANLDHNDNLRQKTFQYAEKSKASLLQAQSKAADALAFAGIPDSLLQKEHDLRIDITWREKRRQSLLDKGLTETDTNTLRISSIIFDLKHDYEALKKRFETQYPAYYRLKYDLSTVSLPYVQDTLLQPKQALLEFFVGDSIIYIFVVRPDTMIVREVKRDFPLEDWTEQFRQGLYGFYTAPKADQTDAFYDKCLEQYLEYAPKLYEKLFAPVKAFLPEQVILVPDGPLGYVPFDALLTAAPKDPNNFKQYPYLLNQHQFSYTYSATLLKEMRDKQHHHKPTKEFVAFAPFYDGDTTLLANMYQYDDLMRKDMQPLAYSGEEVAAASKMMNGEIVAGAAATEERFTSMAGDYRILHLATHGRADNRVGDYAFLAFTEIKDSVENELLYVKDLYNLELNADLVVLSACETGIGKLQRGEGIISLARAFEYAGAKSIVTTLWEVNDKSTSEQMRYFYRELKRGKTKDEALRLARKRYFSEQSVDVCHPFFWAAFVPVGDMRTVNGNSRGKK